MTSYAALGLGILGAACAGSSPEEDDSLEVDVTMAAGTRMIHFSGRLPSFEIDLDQAKAGFSPEPTGAEGEFILYLASYFAALPGGSIAFANRGTSQVAVLDSTGELVTAVGGEGEGPGEFRTFAGLSYCETTGSLAAIELRRITWMPVEWTAGSPATARYDRTEPIRAGVYSPVPKIFLDLGPDCRPVYLVKRLRRDRGGSVSRQQTDTVAIFQGLEPEIVASLPGRTIVEGRALVFSRDPLYAVTRSGLAYARGDSAKVSILDFGGVPRHVITWEEELVPVSDADWELAAGVYSPVGVPPGEPPPHRPVLTGRMVADRTCACLLLRRFTLPSVERAGAYLPPEDWIWIRIEPEPDIAELRFPPGVRPKLVTEQGIWAVGEDDLGVETIYLLPVPTDSRGALALR